MTEPSRDVFQDRAELKLTQLRRQRGGKKGSITKRIKQLDELIQQNGSRTRISSLFQSLLLVQKEAKEINQSLEDLGDDTEDWLDDINLAIDDCKANIEDYLDQRKHEPPSEAPSEDGRGQLLESFMNPKEYDVDPNAQLMSDFARLSAREPPSAIPNLGAKTDLSRDVPHREPLHRPIDSTNQVDSWIDALQAMDLKEPNEVKMENSMMTWFVQQGLPRIRIPWFDGSPIHYVDFISSFKDLVHDQECLSTLQKCVYLQQHVKGEVKRSIQGFKKDYEGYVLSLKRIKFMFGQRSLIAHAVLSKVTNGKPVMNRDTAGLTDLYYTISDCLVTLKKLNYISDLYSTDILRQACRRLPQYLHSKWADQCLRIRRRQEPNLTHLEAWLQERILASKESYLPERNNFYLGKNQNQPRGTDSDLKERKYNYKDDQERNNRPWTGVLQNKEKYNTCLLCKQQHQFFKCPEFNKMDDEARFETAKKLKVCYNCLRPRHFSSQCKSKNSCYESECSQRHHTTLHNHFTGTETNRDSSTEKKSSFQGETQISGQRKGSVFLSVVPVKLLGLDSTWTTTYALLDSGSQSTLLRRDIADKLKLRTKEKRISISTIKDSGNELKVKETKLKATSTLDDVEINIDQCYIVPQTHFHMPGQSYPDDINKLKHVDGIKLHSTESNQIGILIGANIPSVHIPLEVKAGKNSEPIAVKTPFGWTLFGPLGSTDEIAVNKLHIEHEENIHHAVKRIWEQDQIINADDRDPAPSIEDKKCQKKLDLETTFENGKYVVPMLWKKDVNLPNNHETAEKRFNSLVERLKKNPTLHKMYQNTMENYITKQYARKMSPDEVNCTTEKTWYLPHHPVFNPNKPGKIRVVFDAASKHKGSSLNNSLLTGPDLLNNLTGVLMRFRLYPIAISADIEEMFHQVKVESEDKDSLRFLWKDDIFSTCKPETYQMKVHIFGAKDSPTCANYALKQAGRDNLERVDAITTKSVLKSFYVDDLLKSCKDVQTGQTLCLQLSEVMKLGGFKLTKFVSNNSEVLDPLPRDLISPTKGIDVTSNDVVRTLGMRWQIQQDNFTFAQNNQQQTKTKRGILSVVSSIFDPLGFVSPFIAKAKMILQEIWRENKSWDEEVGAETLKAWEKWQLGLNTLQTFNISRCYTPNLSSTKLQLHIFGDASEKAYGAVAYLRVGTEPTETNLIMSKGRVAPTKQQTLPRLELNAATLAVKLYRFIIQEIDLPIEDIHFWSDSTLTLQYIKNENNRFKTFVANRVSEIREITEPSQWHHVPGDQNPADIVSRGTYDVRDLETNDGKKSWKFGPDFLKHDESFWPSTVIEPLDSNDQEIKSKVVLTTSVNTTESILKYEEYSSFDKIIRIIAWIKRFISNCRKKGVKIMVPHLIPTDISNARLIVLRDTQAVFKEEIGKINSNQTISKGKLAPFKPFIDESGLVRIGGRLKNANIPFEAKHQILIPAKTHISQLITRRYHIEGGHAGVNQMLSDIRQTYWILNGRVTAKRIIKACVDCQKVNSKPQIPLMADLPKYRVDSEAPPFTNTGVDFFGPLFIKQGRKRLKRWVSLFTCMTIRSVHLEVVESLETDDFLNALQRFISRRHKPKLILSDCGTNFKGASKELKEEHKKLNNITVGEKCCHHQIEWRFNPPSAPHMGGAWERLVRTVKRTLKHLLKNITLTDFQLMTLVTEVENIVNSRPLTQMSDDPNDLQPITPNHFLKGFQEERLTTLYQPTKTHYRKRWKHVQLILCHFWNRWQKEYLPIITTRSKWQKETPNIEIGNLVLIQTDSSRGQWPLGLVTEVIKGRDGRVRMAKLKTKDNTLLRPVAKLYHLELDALRQGEGDVKCFSRSN